MRGKDYVLRGDYGIGMELGVVFGEGEVVIQELSCGRWGDGAREGGVVPGWRECF